MDDSTLTVVAIVAILIIVILYFNSQSTPVVKPITSEAASTNTTTNTTTSTTASTNANASLPASDPVETPLKKEVPLLPPPPLKVSDLEGTVMVRGNLEILLNKDVVYKVTNVGASPLPFKVFDVTENDIVQFNISGVSPALIGYFTWNGETHISSSCEFVEGETYINRVDQWIDAGARTFEADMKAKYPKARWIIPRGSSSNMTLTWVAKVPTVDNSPKFSGTLTGTFSGINQLQIDIIKPDGTKVAVYPKAQAMARLDVAFRVTTGDKVVFTNYFDAFNGMFGGYWTWNGKTYSTRYCNVFEEIVDYAGTTNATSFASYIGKTPDNVDVQPLQADGAPNKIATYTWTAK
jgi:hypothetical protein